MKNQQIEYSLIVIITIISIGIALLYEKLKHDITNTGLLILVGLFFVIVLYFIIRNLMRKKSDPYEIINPLLIIFTLYSVMVPLNYLTNIQTYGFALTLSDIAKPVMFQFIIICLIGLTALLIGYHTPFTKRLVSKIPVLNVTNRELKITGLILLVLGILSFVTHVARFGGFSSYIKVGYSPERYVIERQAFALGSGLQLIGSSIVILMLVIIKNKKRIWSILWFLFFLWFLAISLLIGQRRYIVYVILMAFIIYNYRIHRIKLRWVIIIGLLTYVFFFTYAYTRGMWAEIGVIKGITETYNIVAQHPELLLPFVGGEFIPPAKVFIEILSDKTFHFRYGASYIVGFIRVLPRAGTIWPEALQTLAQWRMDTYYPGLKEHGIGFVFFTMAEGFVNFGHLGVILHMFIYGFIAKLVFLYFRQNSKKNFVLLTYAVIFSLLLFEGIHAEFGQVLWYITHIYLGPPLLIIIFVKFFTSVVSKNKI